MIDVDDLTVTQSREMVTALLNRNGGGSIKLNDLPQVDTRTVHCCMVGFDVRQHVVSCVAGHRGGFAQANG